MPTKKTAKQKAADKAKAILLAKKKRKYPSGQNAPQSKAYSMENDKEVVAKPTGYRWTDEGAKKLGKKIGVRPTQEDVENYRNKTFKIPRKPNPMSEDGSYRYVYIERRADKADLVRSKKLEVGGALTSMIGEANADPRFDINSPMFKKGGVSQSAPQSKHYNEFRDIEKRAKPVGFRYTERLAKRLGVSPFAKPTDAHIEKYNGNGVYWENRADKSDMSQRMKFEDGGFYARGGSPRIANSESRSYTENMLPFKANNLEAKTLENGDYVVLSYGYYPIWFWCKRNNTWYGNTNKFSMTTAKQISQTRPSYQANMVSRTQLDEMMAKSIEGHDFESMDDEPNV